MLVWSLCVCVCVTSRLHASRRACRLRRIVKHLLERRCLGGDSVSPATRLVERERNASNASNASRLTIFVCVSMYTGRKIDGARVTAGLRLSQRLSQRLCACGRTAYYSTRLLSTMCVMAAKTLPMMTSGMYRAHAHTHIYVGPKALLLLHGKMDALTRRLLKKRDSDGRGLL